MQTHVKEGEASPADLPSMAYSTELCCAVLLPLLLQVVFNPKDSNTFASASLDRTVKVRQEQQQKHQLRGAVKACCNMLTLAPHKLRSLGMCGSAAWVSHATTLFTKQQTTLCCLRFDAV
jgi:hypothetical protein